MEIVGDIVLQAKYEVKDGEEQVTVLIPGSKQSLYSTQVYIAKDMDIKRLSGEVIKAGVEVLRERFPVAYAEFLSGGEIQGTPLAKMDLPDIVIHKLSQIGVVTIEQLAKMPAIMVEQIGMGGLEYQRIAQRWMEEREVSPLQEMELENAQLKAKVANMEDLLTKALSKLEQLVETKKEKK